MKIMKTIAFAAASTLMLLTGCSGNKSADAAGKAAADDEAFYASQPIESGEYRAVSFQYGDAAADRERFDGRVLIALKPTSSGILIYENGNRTHFKAAMMLSKAFEKSDSTYTATDSKGDAVRLIKGSAGTDTLAFPKEGKTVKVAFESKPSPALSPADAWERINARLK